MDTYIHADKTPPINKSLKRSYRNSEDLNSGRLTRQDSVFPVSCNMSVLCMKWSSKQVRWVQGEMFLFSKSICFELRCLVALGSKCKLLY